MATLKLGSTDAITESSGTITVPALGTVTSGNLSNSAIVYPAGHVIQVVSNNSWVAQTFLDTIEDIITVTIDNVLASSYCMIYANMTLHFNEPSGGTAGFNMYLTRGNTNLVTESSSAGGNVSSHSGFPIAPIP